MGYIIFSLIASHDEIKPLLTRITETPMMVYRII